MKNPFMICIANQKGGAGKTTLTMLLAAFWHENGKKVRILDTDPQKSATKWEQRSLEDVPAFPVQVIPMSGLDERQFANSAKKEIEGTDYVLIDTPPNLESKELYAALYVADIVVVPMSADSVHFDALEEFRALVDRVNVKREEKGFTPVQVYLALNRYSPRSRLEIAMANQAKLVPGFKLLSKTLANRKPFSNMNILRTTVYNVTKASDAARQETAELAKEIGSLAPRSSK